MKVFPAVDILAGNCVQLVQGKRETATRYGTPLDCALRWKEEGADGLHVVNLDGAFGSRGANADLIRDIIQKTGLMIELGGGIRTYDDAAALNRGREVRPTTCGSGQTRSSCCRPDRHAMPGSGESSAGRRCRP
jgi:phosphoribosylformimino-5-aminoimidazole carboxamide ribotide isomerase